MGEINHVRDISVQNEMQQEQGFDQIRKEIEKEQYDNREQINRFRYEFDELVHKRVETILVALEDMEHSQKFKDRSQQNQLDSLQSELKELRLSLGSVGSTWT